MFGTRRNLGETVLSFELSFLDSQMQCGYTDGAPCITRTRWGRRGEMGQNKREGLAIPSLGCCWLCYSNIIRKHRLALTLRKADFPAVGVLASDHQVSRMDESSPN